MYFTDTHCHIHSLDYPLNPEDVIKDAKADKVNHLICVGVDLEDSKLACEFAASRSNIWATIGLHPHEAKHYNDNKDALRTFSELAVKDKVVAIGECGLDYHYDHSSKSDQKAILEFQLDVAQTHKLPLVFHVREAFDDFWAVYDNFPGLKGVIHSFTSGTGVLKEALKRDLFIGLNGIMTFTKDLAQLEAAKQVPLDKLVLETDSPYLTPSPLRGSICQPKYVKLTAEFLADLRGCTIEEIAIATSGNAQRLFNL